MHAKIIVVNDEKRSTDDNFTFNKDFSSCIQFLIIVKDKSIVRNVKHNIFLKYFIAYDKFPNTAPTP